MALGNDTTACGDSLTIGTVAQPGNQTYVWSSPSGTAFTQVGTDSIRVVSGTYRLTSTISGTGCSAFDDIDVTLNPLPVVALGNDTTLCGDSLTLSVAAVAGETYVWSVVSGSPFTQLSATSIRVVSGEYSITATNTATTCSSSDSINVTINPLPVVALGNDTTACGDSLTIGTVAQPGNQTYVWSSPSGTAFTQVGTDSIRVVSGTYRLTSTISGTGCSAFDDIDVTLNPLPVVALGNDTTLCGDSLTLSVAAVAGETYVWSVVSGSPFTQLSATSIRVVSGEYSITATNTATTCSSSDSINVTINPLPVVALGNDTTACGDSLTIGTVAAPLGEVYTWSALGGGPAFTQVGTDSIRVVSGTYILTSEITATGCLSSDTIAVTLNPLPVVALGNDTTLCGDSLTLSVAAVAGETYVWSVVSGSPFTQLSATSIRVISGEYSITATNTATTCSSSDSINVTINPLPVVALGNDTTACGDSLTIGTVAAPSGDQVYTWSCFGWRASFHASRHGQHSGCFRNV